MAKAIRQFQEKLKLVDIVYELVDARIPQSSQNPEIKNIIGEKQRLIILTKSDLADPKQTEQWLNYFQEEGIAAVAINAQKGIGMKDVVKKSKEVLADKFEHQRSRGMKIQAIRAVTVGIPNVGKSTVINRLARKNIAQTGNKPGVTKAQQWIKFGKELEMLDTPGILWPKFEDPLVGKKLALTGAIKDKLLNMNDIALYGIEYLCANYPGMLTKRYDLPEGMEASIEDEKGRAEVIRAIADNRGYQDDYELAAETLIYEIRSGMIGKFTFDRVPERVDKDKESSI